MVLPSMKDDSVDKTELLPLSELKIEAMRAHDALSTMQYKITHIPTGKQAAIKDE